MQPKDQTFEGLTARQLAGEEYTKYTKDIPPATETNFDQDGWRVTYSGATKTPPEIDTQNRYWGGPVVYYDLENLSIGNSSHQVDFMSLTPEGWSWKQIKSTNPGFHPPENLKDLKKLAYVDPDNNELIIGDLDGTEFNGEQTFGIAVWLLLVSKFCEEYGYPSSPEANKTMTDILVKRRQEIITAMHSDPVKELIDQPFTAPGGNQQTENLDKMSGLTNQ